MHYNQFNGLGIPDMQSAQRIADKKMENGTHQPPEFLYHVLLLTSHFAHDPNVQVEKVRIAGSYNSVEHAKAAAHSCLFDAGYHREWFQQYETSPDFFEKQNIRQRDGLAVYAVATNGVIFRVRILTTPNTGKFVTTLDDGRIPNALYHVTQTNIEYGVDENGEVRDTNIEGTFGTLGEAREFAKTVLLSKEDGITRESFAEYDEAKPGERDCGYGENVIVHAVGNNGENILVSIVRGHEFESVRLAEAAMRIR